jgi:putative hydrolase of the HAD superfamily
MMGPLLKPLAVLFDLDETLTDRRQSVIAFSARFVADFAASLLEPDGPALAEALRLADRSGYRPREEVFAELRATLAWRHVPTAEEFVTYWNAVFPECCVAQSEAEATVDGLAARGIRLGIVTNGATAVQEAKIDALRLRPRMAAIVISERAEVEKPHAGIFRLALDALGVAPQQAPQVWFVGDHPYNDVLGAAGAGLTGIWLRGVRPWPASHLPPPHQIAALDELLALVQAAESETEGAEGLKG